MVLLLLVQVLLLVSITEQLTNSDLKKVAGEIPCHFFVLLVYNNIKGDYTMAKLAQCGYGSQGQGLGNTTDGYTYVVNDNVRVGQKLQVISTSHGKMPKKFVTTAVPLSVYSENSVRGKEKKVDLESKTDKLTNAYSGAELGASGETVKKQVQIGGGKPQSEYVTSARALAMEKYLKTDPNAQFTKKSQETLSYYKENKPTQTKKSSTFADYSKPFMGEGEQL